MSAPWQWPPGTGGSGGVTSWNTRTGAVVPAAGDYGTNDITNQSIVPGATDTAALNALYAALPTTSIWNPDCPPAAPSALDQEFVTDGALPAGLTSVDFGGVNVATWPKVHQGLEIKQATHAAQSLSWVYFTPTDSEYAVYTRCALFALSGAFNFQVGLGVSQDSTVSTGDLYVIELLSRALASGNLIATALYNAYNSLASNPVTVATDFARTSAFFRLRVNGTTVSVDFSDNGFTWYLIETRVSTYTPAQVILFANNAGTGADGIGQFKWVRYFGGAGSSSFLNQHIGRRMLVGVS